MLDPDSGDAIFEHAATVMDLLGAIHPKGVLFLGKCGGLKKTTEIGHFILPIAAILIALFVGWRWNRREATEQSDIGRGAVAGLWIWMLRVVAPALMAFVLVRTLIA